ncbi:MAG: phosphodiester glycosidase family protein [Oscillospiraceae bacterium]|nr:phosphodiester glycosidase family protein [Oscillospiraceae bacterium]
MSGLILLYCLTAFTDFPVLGKLRDIWIETAMTTADHQWLAEKFFPRAVINKTMSRQVSTDGIVSNPGKVVFGLMKRSDAMSDAPGDGEAAIYADDEQLSYQKDAVKDARGNKILLYDEEQDIKIVEISGFSTDGIYKGRLLFVSDPSRVVVRHTSDKGERGELLTSYLKRFDAIAGINGNGFMDTDGKGSGGQILGWSMADGELWGSMIPKSASAGFTEDGVLVVGTFDDPESYSIRDMVQWGPTLIADGRKLLSGTGGYGCQPRTALGQTADGTVILATVDGRQLHSIGITVGELADILYEYGCVNAALCDGGSSSVMMYGGEIIGSPSTPMKETGRYLPNAILVLKKD